MLRKKKQKYIPNERKEVARLVTRQQQYLEKIESRFAEVKGIADDSLKILELRKLASHIEGMRRTITGEQYSTVTYFAPRKRSFLGFRRYAQLEADDQKYKQLSEQHPALKDIREAVYAHAHRAEDMLAEIVRNCQLDKISESPRFTEAYDQHEPLRRRFKVAADVREALGNSCPSCQKTAGAHNLQL